MKSISSMNLEEPISKRSSRDFEVILGLRIHVVRSVLRGVPSPIRLVTLSATFPNSEDVAQWLHAKHFSFDSSYRPVPIERIVIGYENHNQRNPFLFEVRSARGLKCRNISITSTTPIACVLRRVFNVIQQYSHNKPVMVFSSTRKGCMYALPWFL